LYALLDDVEIHLEIEVKDPDGVLHVEFGCSDGDEGV